MPPLGAKSQIKNLIMLSITASIIVAGCGKKSQSDEILDNVQARAIIAWYLEDVEFDRTVWADVYPESQAKVDVLGRFDGKWIAVRYGEEYLEVGAPQISSTIDYRLDIPKGNREFVQNMMHLLKSARFPPVLSKRKDLGTVKPSTEIRGMFEARRADDGECRVVDAYLNCAGVFDLNPENKSQFQEPFKKKFDIVGGEYCASTFNLEPIGAYRFQMPPNKGFELREGDYTLLCDFSAEDGSKSEDVESATFEVSHHKKHKGPIYKGGLENAFCEQGDELTLHALFVDAKGKEIESVYYDELGKEMDSDVFDCFTVGVYAVKAIATDEHGVQSESHEANIFVYSTDEGLFPGMDHLPGRPVRY